MSENPQFDLFGDPIVDPIDVLVRSDEEKAETKRSYGRRLTERLHALAESGVNPLIGTRGPDGATCGGCVHRVLYGYHNRSYPKCDLGPDSHGPKTDVRLTWPACHRFDPKEE